MNPFILLAKLAVDNYIEDEKIIEPSSDLPKEFFERKSGVFVTIKKDGELRGCIGTYLPTRKNIAEEIIHNAVAAATEDYRFGPIQKEELSHLSYTVYILNPPELIKDISELDPKKYGIIIKTLPPSILPTSIFGTDFTSQNYPKCGLLLPDLEGVDTIDQQILIVCQKAGINPKKEKILIYKFTTEKYE